MNTIFFADNDYVYLVEANHSPSAAEIEKLEWLLQARVEKQRELRGPFVGPRREMLTPWSTNATEIAANTGIAGLSRIEQFRRLAEGDRSYDKMLEAIYEDLTPSSLQIVDPPAPLLAVDDIEAFNKEQGLALSSEEVAYLEKSRKELGRKLSDAEIYGFAQINSEHCRHKIFNGRVVIDGETQPLSMFELIKETSKKAPGNLVSAYKDNVAFIKGPHIEEFVVGEGDKPDYFRLRPAKSLLALKGETHNFPTTVEPFNGAATGSGGEIRDRMAGGQGSIPLAGTAVYMTAYPRLGELKPWEKAVSERKWKYQTPQQILTKASNGASDFGNKFGQPLIAGSVFTMEIPTPDGLYAYDRTVMLAGGIGYGKKEYAFKAEPEIGDKIIVLGGDNYRIGMAGGSVSSVDTGKFTESIELSAVQRSNAEMQKRIYNVIRSLVESESNPIRSIHDHGAGGHMNCLSELLEAKGGVIYVDRLPIGDPTLSVKEILSNESQERMGLIVPTDKVDLVKAIAERERAPMYVVGEVTGDNRLRFIRDDGSTPVDLPLDFLFGSSPKTTVIDSSRTVSPANNPVLPKTGEELLSDLKKILSLEGVACKDWLTNKVDRSVTGRVAQQQCVGPLQVPLADCGIVALDYTGSKGIAVSLGHAPAAGLVNEKAGSVLSISEALTNIVFAPLGRGLESIVLSANWMWPAKNEGEDARLYRAVEACSHFASELGIAIPTGKDSLSMTMKYGNGFDVRAPGTVIITAMGEVSDFRKSVTPDLKHKSSRIIYIDFCNSKGTPLGGSSFAQTQSLLGAEAPAVADVSYFKKAFNAVQDLVNEGSLLAGHDVSSGGVITAACEMAFAGDVGISLSLPEDISNCAEFLFCEKPAVLLQVEDSREQSVLRYLQNRGFTAFTIGAVGGKTIALDEGDLSFEVPVAELRNVWFAPSCALDAMQTATGKAEERMDSLAKRALDFRFPADFAGDLHERGFALERHSSSEIRAAIVREKGTNGDRELAFSLFASGFDVKDVTVSDLASGRENLQDITLIAFPGGFANSDVLGAGRGWAGVCRYNDRALNALCEFYKRPNTLSLGVCNGCQFVSELELLYPEYEQKWRMRRNASHKFESSFLAVGVGETNSVMLKPLIGCRLGIWVAHGEGRFDLPMGEGSYDIPLRYVSSTYPMNPNSSQFNAAALCSKDGRHLVMMPHIERSVFPWQWGYYPEERRASDKVSPWVLAFIAAREWIQANDS